jgi:hypothetical protein
MKWAYKFINESKAPFSGEESTLGIVEFFVSCSTTDCEDEELDWS